MYFFFPKIIQTDCPNLLPLVVTLTNCFVSVWLISCNAAVQDFIIDYFYMNCRGRVELSFVYWRSAVLRTVSMEPCVSVLEKVAQTKKKKRKRKKKINAAFSSCSLIMTPPYQATRTLMLARLFTLWVACLPFFRLCNRNVKCCLVSKKNK